MSISTAQAPVQYFTAVGPSGVFAFGGTVFDIDALTVFALNPANGVITQPVFTVVLADDYSGATVTVPSGLAAGYSVAVARVPIRRQTADLGYQSRTIERQLDRATQDINALFAIVTRAIRLPLAENMLFPELPAATARAGKLAAFDAQGQLTVVANVPVSPAITLGTIWQSALLTATAALARAALGAIGAADSPSITGTFDFTDGRLKAPTRSAGDGGTDVATTAFVNAALAPLLRGALQGLGLANDGTSPNTVLDIAAGVAIDSTNAVVMTLAAALTKSTAGTWAAGTGQNGMGQGLTIQNSTWYHVFAIVAAGVVDAYFDTDVGAANKPGTATAFRRIGSFKTDGSAHVLAFVQSGDHFQWAASGGLDVATTNPGTAAVLAPLNVPPGVNVRAEVNVQMVWATSGWPSAVLLSDPAVSDEVPTAISGPLANGAALSLGGGIIAPFKAIVRTDTARRIRYRLSASGASDAIRIATVAWTDRRGRDG